MLPKVFRISKNDLARNIHPATVLKTVHFSLRIKKNDHTHPRFSVVVSKKVDKRAVGRNFLRRQTYGAVLPLIPSLTALDIIISVKKTGESLSPTMVEQELTRALTPHLST